MRYHEKTKPRRVIKFNNKADEKNYIEECKLIHTTAVQFAEQSIKYMFYANAGAIVYVLLKFDIDTFFIPICMFSFGIVYTILGGWYMYTRSVAAVVEYFKNKINPFRYWHVSKFFRPVCLVVMYIPALIFMYGVCCSVYLFRGDSSLLPHELLREVLKII